MVDLAASRSAPPLLVFADDWGRHPSSCQHLIRKLLPRRNVSWVNTIGMRPPRFDAATVTRVAQKLRDWRRPGGEACTPLPSGLSVHNPAMWPWFRRPADRWLNRSLLLRQLRTIVREFSEPPIAVTTLPITADLMGRLPVVRWVYYCVDDFAKWPGLDQEPLEAMEREVVRRADVLISASEHLQARLAEWGRSSYLLTHGVDLEHWSCAAHSTADESWAKWERPLVAFWGLIDARMDSQMIARTAESMRRGTLLLVGPHQNPAPSIFAPQRVVHVPPVPFADLPRLAQAADVLIMPYADLPVTRAMQPLKLKEYLATGKPIVASDLPAVREWADCLDVAADATAFAAAVQQRLAEGIPESQRVARARLSKESWSAKASMFERWLDRDISQGDAINGVNGYVGPVPCPS